MAKQETEEGYIRYSVAQPAVFTIAKTRLMIRVIQTSRQSWQPEKPWFRYLPQQTQMFPKKSKSILKELQ